MPLSSNRPRADIDELSPMSQGIPDSEPDNGMADRRVGLDENDCLGLSYLIDPIIQTRRGSGLFAVFWKAARAESGAVPVQ